MANIESEVRSRGAALPITGFATRPHTHRLRRSIGFALTAVAAPLAIGASVASLARSRRSGMIAGGITAAALAALRWQLQRWFTDEPHYQLEQRLGELELRRYAPRVEARTRIAGDDFEHALDEGFRRLARYVFGRERLAMTAPVTVTPGDGGHTLAFVMPPGRTLADLPVPEDRRIELVEVPPRRVAVLRFRGRYKGDVVRAQARRLANLARTAGLVGSNEPTLAGFDPPWTLPWLRRMEMWLELAE